MKKNNIKPFKEFQETFKENYNWIRQGNFGVCTDQTYCNSDYNFFYVKSKQLITFPLRFSLPFMCALKIHNAVQR